MRTWVSMGMAMLTLVSCQQTPPSVDTPVGEDAIAEKPANYQALPGQAATSTTPSDTTTAFDFAAASYASSPGLKPDSTDSHPPVPHVAPPALPQQFQIPDKIPAPPPIPDPRPVGDIPLSTNPVPSPAATSGSAGISAATASSNSTGYAVQVTNGTSGRLFVEVQDDSGNIFPFGSMYAGQRIASSPQELRPISGQLQVVIRDPDQAGAPELRRYRVTPPPDYEGHTLGVTILPGGRYRASLDGKVYFRSTEPEPAQPAQLIR